MLQTLISDSCCKINGKCAHTKSKCNYYIIVYCFKIFCNKISNDKKKTKKKNECDLNKSKTQSSHSHVLIENSSHMTIQTYFECETLSDYVVIFIVLNVSQYL